jgi:hypothetical protein
MCGTVEVWPEIEWNAVLQSDWKKEKKRKRNKS